MEPARPSRAAINRPGDGIVAGTWLVDLRRREASLTPKPFERLAKATGPALTEEAERLLRFIKPTAGSHAVRLADA